MKIDSWSKLDPEVVKKELGSKSVVQLAEEYGISKWLLYKFTSIHQIDVWECKRSKMEAEYFKPEKDYNKLEFTKENLENLVKLGYSQIELSKVFNTSVWLIQKYSMEWNVSLRISAKDRKDNREFLICNRCGKKYYTSEHDGYCSKNCYVASQRNVINNIYPIGSKEHEIIKLYNLGFSYREIAKIVSCSKSTVSKLCNKYGAITPRLRKYKKYKFLKPHLNRLDVTAEEIMKKYNYETEVECYLTGDKINITTGDYHLDHIFPKSRGGSNTIENIAITTPEANIAKGALTVSEFLDLCEKVLKHHNYTVIKPE